jgi:hypothetical protein
MISGTLSESWQANRLADWSKAEKEAPYSWLRGERIGMYENLRSLSIHVLDSRRGGDDIIRAVTFLDLLKFVVGRIE